MSWSQIYVTKNFLFTISNYKAKAETIRTYIPLTTLGFEFNHLGQEFYNYKLVFEVKLDGGGKYLYCQEFTTSVYIYTDKIIRPTFNHTYLDLPIIILTKIISIIKLTIFFLVSLCNLSSSSSFLLLLLFI